MIAHQTVTDASVELWADRAMKDFSKKVCKNAPAKQKDWIVSQYYWIYVIWVKLSTISFTSCPMS